MKFNRKQVPFGSVDVVVIKGDGIGRTIDSVLGVTDSAVKIADHAVAAAYGEKAKIRWIPAAAGEIAIEQYEREAGMGSFAALTTEAQQDIALPKKTLDLIHEHAIVLKGPLGTPTGAGYRSPNVALRKLFDLYSCIRPVKYFPGAPSPNAHAKDIDAVIFRENIEDVYAGIEFEAGSDEQRRLQETLINTFHAPLDPDTPYAIGIKPMSAKGTKRLMRRALEYAIDNGYKTVTVMHKGNIQKFTEGAFQQWCYDLAREEFGDRVVFETNPQNPVPEGKLLLNSRIADVMFMLTQQQPGNFGVIVCPNLNGDYLSDHLAAMVGGLGVSPGANIGDRYAIFEATHGTAPDIVGRDLANPSSVTLSAAMLLDYLGWSEAADLVRQGIGQMIARAGDMAAHGEKPLPVTGDLAKQYPGYTIADGIPCSKYVAKVIAEISRARN